MRWIDWLMVAAVTTGLLAVLMAAPILGLDPIGTLIIASTAVATALALMLHRRVRSGQRSQIEATGHAASQTEALFSIFATTQPTAPLPPLGGWAASPDLLRLLLEVVMRERPGVILEASSGASTLVLAYGLQRLGAGGRVVALEHDAGHAIRTRESIAAAGLSHVATVVHAPLVTHQLEGKAWQWYDLSGLPDTPPAGLLVVDGPPGTVQPMARYPALPLLLDRLAPAATVVMDDSRRPDETAIAERWVKGFPGWQLEFRHTEKGAAILRRTTSRG